MSLLSRKGLLAITAVVDIALHAHARPVSAKALAARNTLPPRHLEPVLQALVREGILRGIRGPRGGYALARERRRITAEDILRATASLEERDEGPIPESTLLLRAVLPSVAQAEQEFAAALARINVEDLAVLAAG
jgi:Rrf2 family protein